MANVCGTFTFLYTLATCNGRPCASEDAAVAAHENLCSCRNADTILCTVVTVAFSQLVAVTTSCDREVESDSHQGKQHIYCVIVLKVAGV